MIHNWDVSFSIRSLNCSTVMREIDGLNLIFINCYVQCSHHNSIEVRPQCSFLRTNPPL